MNKEEIKALFERIDRRLLLHNAIGEPISKDFDNLIKLSVAYEELEQENTILKQALNEIREYFKKNYYFGENAEKIRRDILKIIDKVGGNEE